MLQTGRRIAFYMAEMVKSPVYLYNLNKLATYKNLYGNMRSYTDVEASGEMWCFFIRAEKLDRCIPTRLAARVMFPFSA